MPERTEEDYQAAKAFAIEGMVEMMRVADELGKDQMLVAADFMAAFQQAAQSLEPAAQA